MYKSKENRVTLLENIQYIINGLKTKALMSKKNGKNACH